MARRNPRLTASYMPRSFSMNAFTLGSCGNQSCVPSSEQESCTMCSCGTSWSATEGIQSLSHRELRKLGVMMEKNTGKSGVGGDKIRHGGGFRLRLHLGAGAVDSNAQTD